MAGLSSYVDPNWTPDPDVNPNSLASLPPAQASYQPPPAGMAGVAAQPAAPVRGVAYEPSANSQTGIPAATPQYAMSPQEAYRLAGQGMVSKPAGFQPSTKSETLEGRAPSKDLEQATADKLKADQEAILAQSGYDTALMGAQGEAQRRLSIIDEAQARDQAQRAAATQARLAVDRDHIQGLMQEAAKPQQSASEEYWGSKSTLGKVMTGLSMALRGFVFSGYGRGGDPMEWLNQQIGQVVQDQQNRAARNREAVGNAQTLYGMNKEALGDDERAKLATEVALRTQIGAQLDRRIAEAVSDPAAQLRGAQLKKAIADQNAATLEQYWDKTADKHTTSEALKYQAAQTGGQDVLARIKRANEIKSGFGTLTNDTAAEDQQLEQQQKKVNLRKSMAETEKTEAEAKAAGGGTGQALGQEEVKSTAYNPARIFQGTEANEATIGHDAYNARLSIALTKAGLSPRIAKDAISNLSINDGDTDATIAVKKKAAAHLLGAAGASSIPGVTPGVAPGEGEGEP